MKSKLEQAKKLMNDLSKLDAQYLTDFPKKLSRPVYLKKRNALRKKFEALKK